jgi:hypothetical protein
MGAAMNQIEPDKNPMATLKKLHRWRMAFFGLVILLAGIVIGASSTLILCRHKFMGPRIRPRIAGERMFQELRRRLDLSPEQEEKIKPICEKRMQRLNEIHMKALPQIVEQIELMNKEISSLLDEHQNRLWQRHLQRLQGRFTRGRHRHRDGPRRHRPDPNRHFRRGPGRFDWRQPPEGPCGLPEPNNSQDAAEF